MDISTHCDVARNESSSRRTPSDQEFCHSPNHFRKATSVILCRDCIQRMSRSRAMEFRPSTSPGILIRLGFCELSALLTLQRAFVPVLRAALPGPHPYPLIQHTLLPASRTGLPVAHPVFSSSASFRLLSSRGRVISVSIGFTYTPSSLPQQARAAFDRDAL